MGRFLRLINGIPRMADEAAGSSIEIYDESLEVVASGAGAGQINGPITTGTPITLPNAKVYTDEELEVYLNGTRLDNPGDYAYEGSGARTQISFAFDIIVTDIIRFRIDRSA